MKLAIVSFVASSAALLVACASAPPPTAKLARSEGSIRAAQELRADSTPSAQLHLKLARDQLATAKRLMADGDNERAEYVLLRAEADADVAIALAKEAAARDRASAATEQLRVAKSTPAVSSETTTTGAPMTAPSTNAPTQTTTPSAMPTNVTPPRSSAPPVNTVPDSTIPPSVGR